MGSSTSKRIVPKDKHAFVIGISDYTLTLNSYKSLENPA